MVLFSYKNRLDLTPDGFSQHIGIFHKPKILWRDIQRAVGIKSDLVTYMDNLIVLETRQRKMSISEADGNFKSFEAIMLDRLTGFPSDWYAQIERQAVNNPVILWRRS